MSDQQIDARIAAWMARIAEALEHLAVYNPGYGEFYVNGVTFGFEGEDIKIRLVPADEAGAFDISLDGASHA